MKEKSTTQQITDQIEYHIGEEINRNKIFVVLLGALILCMAFFGKIINDDANDAFNKVEEHFSLCNDYLSPIFDVYSCVTVDGVVKIAHKIKNENEVLEEMRKKIPPIQTKIKYYIENSKCSKVDLVEKLKTQTNRTNEYWNVIMKNLESQNGLYFANNTLESGELYKYTDDILETVNSLLDYHLDAAKKDNDKCQKSLKSFKKICIVSSSIGLTIIMAVILKFFSEKNEIQKRRINDIGGKNIRSKRKYTPRKKTISNKK